MATVLSAVILTLAALLILRDIAVRRRAEEAMAEEHNLLRGVMDAMPEQVFVTDRNGCFIIDNISHRTFIGVKMAREVEGKTPSDFFPAAVADEMSKDDRGIMETGQPMLHQEGLVVRGDGQVIWVATTKVPLHDVKGACIGLVGVSTDISVRKEAEERLRLAAEQLRKQQHRAPGVRLHRLPRSPGAAPQNPGLRRPPRIKCSARSGRTGGITSSGCRTPPRRMQTLLHDLLTLSRVTSKAQPFEPVDLGEVVQDVVSDLEVRIEQPGPRSRSATFPPRNRPLADAPVFQNLISQRPQIPAPGARPR